MNGAGIAESLGKLLGLADDVPDQLEEAVGDLPGLLLAGGLIGHCGYSLVCWSGCCHVRRGTCDVRGLLVEPLNS